MQRKKNSRFLFVYLQLCYACFTMYNFTTLVGNWCWWCRLLPFYFCFLDPHSAAIPRLLVTISGAWFWPTSDPPRTSSPRPLSRSFSCAMRESFFSDCRSRISSLGSAMPTLGTSFDLVLEWECGIQSFVRLRFAVSYYCLHWAVHGSYFQFLVNMLISISHLLAVLITHNWCHADAIVSCRSIDIFRSIPAPLWQHIWNTQKAPIPFKEYIVHWCACIDAPALMRLHWHPCIKPTLSTTFFIRYTESCAHFMLFHSLALLISHSMIVLQCQRTRVRRHFYVPFNEFGKFCCGWEHLVELRNWTSGLSYGSFRFCALLCAVFLPASPTRCCFFDNVLNLEPEYLCLSYKFQYPSLEGSPLKTRKWDQ
jgi:hypothetical protein